jgi:hypothetical protein
MPGREPACFAIDLLGRQAPVVSGDIVDRVVVEQEERGMQTRENDVLVVARVAQNRRSAGRARQILEQSAVLDDELDS